MKNNREYLEMVHGLVKEWENMATPEIKKNVYTLDWKNIHKMAFRELLPTDEIFHSVWYGEYLHSINYSELWEELEGVTNAYIRKQIVKVCQTYK